MNYNHEYGYIMLPFYIIIKLHFIILNVREHYFHNICVEFAYVTSRKEK